MVATWTFYGNDNIFNRYENFVTNVVRVNGVSGNGSGGRFLLQDY